jgi:hypothetical protein
LGILAKRSIDALAMNEGFEVLPMGRIRRSFAFFIHCQRIEASAWAWKSVKEEQTF